MKIDTPSLSANATAAVLTAKLGDMRSWYPFLIDCIRGQQEAYGYVLLPCAEMTDCRGMFRPRYSAQDIQEFVENVQAAAPQGSIKPSARIVLCLDDGRHWRANRFCKDGTPVKPRRIPGAGIGRHTH